MKKLSNQELYHFCEHFTLLLRSGMSAVDSLRVLAEDGALPKYRELLLSIMRNVEDTGSLSKAFSLSGVFPDYMIAYTKTGEETGCLDEVMDNLTAHYEHEDEIAQHIRSAITYPFIMSGMMLTVIVILLYKVLPVFQQVFRQMGMELSGFSLGLMGTGERLSQYSAVFVILLFLFIVFLLFLFLHPKGHRLLQKIILQLPGIKKIPRYMDYARLSKGISLGLRSGLAPDESLALALELVTYPEIVEKIKHTQKFMENGKRFSESLIESDLYTGMEAQLILISVQAGAIDEVMDKLSQRYNERAISSISQIISVVEPTIVVVLSVIVGLVLLSVMMPLLGILSQMMV